jgi:uncharacterized protein
MVSPTLAGRERSLDFLRGIAVLGILLANIPAFSSPFLDLLFERGHQGDFLWLEAIRTTLVTGKFRSTLAILFGIGLWMQHRKRRDIPGAWPTSYIKRSLLLATIGFFHGAFLWYGDILYLYGLVAALVCFLAPLSNRTLGVVAGILFFITSLFAFLSMLPGGDQESSSIGPLVTQVETAIHLGDDHLPRLALRAVAFGLMSLVVVPTVGLEVAALFLVGILLARSGVVSDPTRNPKLVRTMLIVGFGLGLPLNIACAVAGAMGYASQVSTLVEVVGGPLQAVGYVALGAIFIQRKPTSALERLIAPVGRMALSAYLLQSLLGVAIFDGWGLGLFGQTNDVQDLLAVAAIWAIDIAICHMWLRRYAMGPMEWLLRAATEGRKLPIRRTAAPVYSST